jgi:hypothetical protein
MRRSPSSLLLALVAGWSNWAGCGAPHTFHKDPERGCPLEGELTIAAQEDVAKIAGCTAISTLVIRTGAKLELAPLGRLEAIRGDLLVGPSVGLEELALPRLRTVDGTIRVVGNGNLRAVFLPKLEHAKRIEIEGNVAISNLSLPKLTAVEAVVVTGQAELELIDIPSLAKTSELVITDNPKLVMIEGEVTAKTLRLENNKQLPAEVNERLHQGP